MNEHYIRDDEPMTSQRPPWIVRWFWLLYLGGLALLGIGGLVSLLVKPVHAQTISAPTRATAYDWACLDAAGTVLSTHQRFDTAFVACYNNPAGDRIQGGTYKLAARGTTPPPTCPPKPADETRAGACPAGTTGSWTQTQSYGAVDYPTCWVPSGFIPSTPPEGACVAPAPTLTAPTLSASITPNATNPTNSNVRLSWTAIAGATGYDIERCTGAGCTSFASIGTAVADSAPAQGNTNLPPGLTYSYRVRAFAAIKGPYSNVVTITTPTTPAPTTGSAKLTITPPAIDTEGKPLTDLIGYTVRYGNSPTALTQSAVVLLAPGHVYSIDGLAAGTWYFTAEAVAGAAACLQPAADCAVRSSVPAGPVSRTVP